MYLLKKYKLMIKEEGERTCIMGGTLGMDVKKLVLDVKTALFIS
jgi:hypothetical protein